MNKFIIPELDYQQNDYIFRKFYADGTIAGFVVDGTQGTDGSPNGVAAFCPWAASTINLYDYPVNVTLVNTRGVSFIPSTLQRVDEDVVMSFVASEPSSILQPLNVTL